MRQYGYQKGTSATIFAAKEAYRTIRANLMFSVARAGCKVLMFTSSIEGEGKTTSAVNVAFSLVRSNKRVLLMDMDLRRPRIHRLLKFPSAPGLTNYLSGFNTAEEILHRDVASQLDVICAGTLSPNPAEMVASERVMELLEALRERYDFIILDTPPVNVVSDILPLVKNVDGVVLVVRPNYTARKEVQKSVSQIEFVGGKVLGVILNGVQIQKRGFGRYGRYGRYGNDHYHHYGEISAEEGAEPEEKEQETESEQRED